jgi:hypothetical protein
MIIEIYPGHVANLQNIGYWATLQVVGHKTQQRPTRKNTNKGTVVGYLQRNEGVFYFVLPIYKDLTWILHQINFSIFTKEKGLLLNRFDNRKYV